MNCKKCNSPKTVILRKKDFYCDDCFMISTNHKFRACIGKNKVLSPNYNVLICLSGGKGSTVLLDLIQYATSLDNTKKLRIVPYFLHLLDDDGETIAKSVLDQCKKYNFTLYVAHVSNYLMPNLQLSEANCIPKVEHDIAIQFKSLLNSMPPTAINDFLLKIKRNLFVRYAKLLECDFVFTAETTNTLAINLLCNLATGRGSQVQNDVGFCDMRDERVKILRPIKDISKEELDYYVAIRQLQPIWNSSIPNNSSLQSVISSFVCDLQENFQSTISTVCKTADKLGVNEDITKEKCILCESALNTKNLELSALEATNISRSVSFRNSQSDHNTKRDIFENNTGTSVFPLVHKYLCYGCSRNHSEMNSSNLPQHLQKALYP